MSAASPATAVAARHEVCIAALAEAFRADGEILVSPIGPLPTVAARLARRTFAPDMLLTDGVAALMADTPALGAAPQLLEGQMTYRQIFDLVWWGRRHVVMGAGQIDRYGNQNIALIGDIARPKSQLLGMRGAPGNTICHATSYWVPNHSPKTFVDRVDVVSGVGGDRARALGVSGRFHNLRLVVSNLGVFDFGGPDGSMRVRSVHPGVTIADVIAATGFELAIDGTVPTTPEPTAAQLTIIRELDPTESAAAGIVV